jgi:hypothetical protein
MSIRRFRCCVHLAVACFAACNLAHAQDVPRFTVRAEVGGKLIEGTPLTWSDANIQLLCRDGALRTFKPEQAKNAAKIADTFRSYSAGEMRTALQREFGGKFDVSGTGHYLVVHPAGQRDYWADRFEQLYRSFTVYFSVRGLRPADPEFPLVAIVVPRQDDMIAYAAAEGVNINRNVLGYYSSHSNRVILFDQGGGKAKSKDWAENSDTIIHEATHQSAFNTGIHRRWPAPPAWVAEGMGTLFEAPGVWDSQNHANQADRINRGRLSNYRQIADKIDGGALAELIASDRIFRENPAAAYAMAWALTFYLTETQPGKYGDYLKRTTAHKGVDGPTEKQRIADFTAVFGADFGMHAARFRRYMAEVKEPAKPAR